MEIALRDALAKAEIQAIKHKDKFRARTREPKDGKTAHEPELARVHGTTAMSVDRTCRTWRNRFFRHRRTPSSEAGKWKWK